MIPPKTLKGRKVQSIKYRGAGSHWCILFNPLRDDKQYCFAAWYGGREFDPIGHYDTAAEIFHIYGAGGWLDR